MKKEKYTLTFSSGGKSVTVDGDVFSGLVKSLKKNEKVDNCPRCHKTDFRQWLWVNRTMRKCLSCGRIWSFD